MRRWLLAIAVALTVSAVVLATETAAAQDPLWVRQFGTTGSDQAFAVAVDASGNVYVTGFTNGTFAGETSAGLEDAFVRKYDASGGVVWTRQFGTTGYDEAFGVAVDASGNVYVTGFTTGTFAGQISAGGDDAFLRKYDASGNVVWTRQFGTPAGERAFGVVVDASMNAYVVGYTESALGGPFSGGNSDAFVRKFDSGGNVLWTRQFGGAGTTTAYGVAIDGSGNVYVGGRTAVTVTVDCPPCTRLVTEGFVRKYDSGGNSLWSREFGTVVTQGQFTVSSLARGVAVDASGNAYAVGTVLGGALEGQTGAGLDDAVLRKYDPSGNVLWTRQFGTAADDVGFGVAVDPSGNAVVSGITQGTFAGQAAAGVEDAFVRMYDSGGNVVWTRQFGTAYTDRGTGVAIDASGNAYVTGLTGGTLPGQTSSGDLDAFLVKFGPKSDQSITFGSLQGKTFGDAPFALSATATSNLAVSFTASGNCSVSANLVTITGAGSCVITAAQDGDANFNPATPVTQSFAIAKADQTISFGQLADKTFGEAPFALSATASSSLAVSFTASGNCSVGGNLVTITGAGSCAITALQDGDVNYKPAPPVTQSFTILKADQTITFGALADKTFGDAPFTVSATASSGLIVGFTSTGACAVVASVGPPPFRFVTFTVTLVGAGGCAITALQNGDANHNPAPPVTQSFAIAKADQAISFAALAGKTFGDPEFDVRASSSSGLLVGFSATGNCAVRAVVGSGFFSVVTFTVTLTGAGGCAITALQNGDANYNPAPPVTQSFAIGPKAASVTPAAASKTYGSADPAFTGTLTGFLASDNVTASYSRTAGETVAGSPYTISATLGPAGVLGNYTITYNTASFAIGPKAAAVSSVAAGKLYGGVDPGLTTTNIGFLAADLGPTKITFSASRAPGESVGTYTITSAASDNGTGLLGNYAVTHTTAIFTITVNPLSLCDLTKRYIQSSAKYAALPAAAKANSNLLANSLCVKLGRIAPTATPARKAAAIAAYELEVDALVRAGWLTPAQATFLKNGASAL
jgi:hypothetical protein